MRVVNHARLVAVVVLAAMPMLHACKGKGEQEAAYKQACTHFVDVAKDDIKSQPVTDEVKKELQKQADEKYAADVSDCTDRCKNGSWDCACLQGVTKLIDAKACKR